MPIAGLSLGYFTDRLMGTRAGPPLHIAGWWVEARLKSSYYGIFVCLFTNAL